MKKVLVIAMLIITLIGCKVEETRMALKDFASDFIENQLK